MKEFEKTDYAKAAKEAKLKFCTEFRELIERRNLKKKNLARATGFPETTISKAVNESNPSASESFIRMVSLKVKGMEFAYKSFRDEVDYPYIPQRVEPSATIEKERKARVKLLSDITAMLDQLRDSI